MPETQKIAVIGAGIGGMAAAYDLAKAGHKVTIYESADGVGGLAAGFKEPGWDWSVERFYHHWFATDKHMLGLIDELGWSSQVRFPRPTTVMYNKGEFTPFDSMFTNIPLFLLHNYPIWDVVRFGLVGVYLRLTNNWQALEKSTAEAWMRKYAGNHIYEVMWKPMLNGKFGERYASVVNMAWLWARLHSRTTRLGTFEGGFQAFCDQFADRLRQMGVQICLSTQVRRIARAAGGGLDLETASETNQYDRALVTTSPALLARLAPDLPPDYLHGLLALESMGAVVTILALKHPLSPEGYYWYNIPKSAGFPFLSLVEHTNFLSPEYFGGDHIVYIGDYLEPDHENFKLSPEELVTRFLPSLTRFNPDFKPDWVRKFWVYRTPYAQPIPRVNHSQNIPAIQTPLPGLYFASMSQVYPWDRGTNFAVEIGRRAARLMQEP
ncbi:MAG TPA: NAD(P)/FAD-dependent oxidoreductase [Anaerolineaceae bacterium]